MSTTTVEDSVLEQELEYFREHLDEMLEAHEGEWVVIKGESVLGFFEEFEIAFEKGVEEFGRVSFLVKEVSEDQTFSAPALKHGLING